MNDNEFQCEHLESYIDDLLVGDERTEFERHLADCKACQNELNTIRQFDRDIGAAWSRVLLPETVKPSDGKIWKRNDKAPLYGLIVAAALIAIGIGLVGWLRWSATDVAQSVPANQDKNVAERFNESASPEAIRPWLARRGFAKAQFKDNAIGVPLESQSEFTVIRVVPKITYFDSN